jgi:hypothetical protein
MKYNFFINPGGYPEFGVEEKYWQLWELGGLEQDYLEKIVAELEKLVNGELEIFEFGREVYLLQCDRKECKVIDLFENGNLELTIPTLEIYSLMKDWRNYLVEFKNRKGNQ